MSRKSLGEVASYARDLVSNRGRVSAKSSKRLPRHMVQYQIAGCFCNHVGFDLLELELGKKTLHVHPVCQCHHVRTGHHQMGNGAYWQGSRTTDRLRRDTASLLESQGSLIDSMVNANEPLGTK